MTQESPRRAGGPSAKAAPSVQLPSNTNQDALASNEASRNPIFEHFKPERTAFNTALAPVAIKRSDECHAASPSPPKPHLSAVDTKTSLTPIEFVSNSTSMSSAAQPALNYSLDGAHARLTSGISPLTTPRSSLRLATNKSKETEKASDEIHGAPNTSRSRSYQELEGSSSPLHSAVSPPSLAPSTAAAGINIAIGGSSAEIGTSGLPLFTPVRISKRLAEKKTRTPSIAPIPSSPDVQSTVKQSPAEMTSVSNCRGLRDRVPTRLEVLGELASFHSVSFVFNGIQYFHDHTRAFKRRRDDLSKSDSGGSNDEEIADISEADSLSADEGRRRKRARPSRR